MPDIGQSRETSARLRLASFVFAILFIARATPAGERSRFDLPPVTESQATDAPLSPAGFTLTEARWDPRFSLPGVNGYVYALAWDGSNLYVGGVFYGAGNCRDCRNIARFDGTNWWPLGSGANNFVQALLWNGGSLYAGGGFTEIGTCVSGCRGVARWDGSTWNSLDGGMNGSVYALASVGTAVYAGGSFTTAGACASGCRGLARWGSSPWTGVSTGVVGTVYSIAPSAAYIYVGGQFTSAGTCTTNCVNIARFVGATWTSLGTGTNDAVTSLAWTGSELFAGGYFTSAGTCTSNCNYVARWNGTLWSAAATGMGGETNDLAWDGSSVYAVGNQFVARWTGSAWSSFASGLDHHVYAVLANATDVYVGGWFQAIGGVPARRVARRSKAGTVWNPLLPYGHGTKDPVAALTFDGQDLYAAGSFRGIGSCAEASCTGIAKWNGRQWSSVGAPSVANLGVVRRWQGRLYAGGTLTATGSCASGCRGVLVWDGSAWSLAGGTVASSAWALFGDSEALYAGGNFVGIGSCGAGCRGIAKWDGSSWSPLGTGVNGTVDTVVAVGSDLYVGGTFVGASSCGSACTNVARWDGNAWQPLGSGVPSRVVALAHDGTSLFVGGEFSSISSCSSGFCNRVARWNGSAWHGLGFGLNGTLNALAIDGQDLFVGGSLSTSVACGPCSGVMRWNGSTWSDIAPNTYDQVYDLAVADEVGVRSVYAGGLFDMIGGTASLNIARWRDGVVWDGGGADGLGSSAANWSGDAAPTAGEVAIFDRTSSKAATLDGSFGGTLAGLSIEDGYAGEVALARDLQLTGGLLLTGGSLRLADLGGAVLSLDGSIRQDAGILRQDGAVNAALGEFLRLNDAAMNVRHRGAEVDATVSGSLLGTVSVKLSAADPGSPCPGAALQPPHVPRCFELTATGSGAATLRLWAPEGALGALSPSDLSVYRDSGAWTELTSTRSVGGDGDGWRFGSGMTPGFSRFMLGEHPDAPGLPGAVPASPVGLQVAKNGGAVDLDWSASCGAASDYAVYSGTLGNWAGYSSLACSTAGATSWSGVPPDSADCYFLVVPLSASEEGSYGRNSSNVERPPALSPCIPASDTASCP